MKMPAGRAGKRAIHAKSYRRVEFSLTGAHLQARNGGRSAIPTIFAWAKFIIRSSGMCRTHLYVVPTLDTRETTTFIRTYDQAVFCSVVANMLTLLVATVWKRLLSHASIGSTQLHTKS